jgi:ATPase subunit of ABC transporter with duplicated ATPase domains
MILSVHIESKTIGNKQLFDDLRFKIERKEKVALIGRNGVGKTTLFNMLTGKDDDYAGTTQLQRNTVVASTAQEHHVSGNPTVIEYILQNLPEYASLHNVIETYPLTMGDNLKKIEVYSNALERFGDLDYFNIESNLLQTLAAYEIDETKARGLFKSLSGGQKRFVELTRIEHAHADLALIDEPTNHMDYIAKAAFIDWFKAAKETVVVISHDRDVLQFVDKIIEIKSGRAYTYNGNYSAYLTQNAQTAATQMHDYDIANRTLENLQKQILQARARKPSWSGTADQKNPFVVMERRLQKQYDEIKESMVKPNFWIDRESADNLHKKVSDNYEKFKAKNISIRKSGQHEQRRELVRIEDLQLGYAEKPLFRPINLQLNPGDRLRLIGRNGAGKTTLVRAIADAVAGQRSETWRHGSIFVDKRLRLSVYEQEPGAALLSMPLGQAIEHIYESLDLRVTDEIVMRTMGNFLFNPYEDKETLVANLSGGQKARLQIIRMLANDPNVLILDEPTNHLDLPSIEELEDALNQYHGALLYISHDSYFAKNLGGDSVVLEP